MKTIFQFIGISFILLFILKQGVAQTEFAKVYYQEFQELQSGAVAATFDGGFVIAGERDGQYFLLKIDETGDTLWNKTILGKDNYYLNVNLISLKDSCLLFVASYLNPDTAYLDVLCMNFDADGNVIWSKTYDFGKTAEPNSVSQTFDGGFIIAGRLHEKMLVLKLDNFGNVLWSKMLEGGNYVHSIKQTIDTGYIISGNIIDNEPFFVSALLLKLSPDGSVEWSKSFNGTSNFNDGLDVIEDNGFVLAMWTGDSTIIVKTNQTGDVLWTKRYLPTVFNDPLFPFAKLQKTTEGRFILLAPIITYSGENNVFLELNESGEVLWARQIEMYAVDVTKTSDKGFLIVGNGPISMPKSYRQFDPEIGVIKTDSLGHNSTDCIYDITINAVTNTIISQTVSFGSETIDPASNKPILQFVSEPLTVKSGCVAVPEAINNNQFDNNIRVFPNPSTGVFTIQTTNGEQLSGLEVYNTYGSLVYQIDGLKSTEATIDLSGNPMGIYFLKLRNNKKVYSRKIVVY